MEQRKSGGWGLIVRLLALVTLPLILVAVLSVDRMRADRSASAVAHQMTSVVELEQAVAAAQLPAYVERLATAGLSTIDRLHVPRATVLALTGLDAEKVVGESRVQLDAALGILETEIDRLAPPGSTLGADLRVWREQMVAQRSDVDAQAGDPDVANRVFDRLDEILNTAVAGAETTIEARGLPTALLADYQQLRSLSQVIRVSGEQASATLIGILQRDRDHFAELVSARARFQFVVDDFTAHLTASDAATFTSITAAATIPEQLLSSPPPLDPTTSVLDPAVVRFSAVAVTTQMSFLDSLNHFSAAMHHSIVDKARRSEAQTHSRLNRGVVVVACSLAITLLFVAVFGRSILVPLRRLLQRAVAINRGETRLPALRPTGPRGTRHLATAMNDMLGTLQVIDRQTDALARGDLRSTALTEIVPGNLGRSIRESVDHLTAVTNELHESEALASAIIDHAADAIWTVSTSGAIESANVAAERMVGRSEAEQIGRPLGALLSGDRGEQWLKVVGADPIEVAVQRVEVPTAHRPVNVVFAHDISERKRFEKRLIHQTRHDSLTGLPNRFAILADLENLLVDGDGPCAVLFVDIDGFKSVNDSHGHAVGDLVLQEIARRIARHARRGDLVARLGGDEFLVVMPASHGLDEAVDVSNRLIGEIEQPYEHGERLFTLSASVGVALVGSGVDALDAIQRADTAVYLAKRRGRGRVEIFNQDLQASIEQRAELELALRETIRQGELSVHLQPVFDLHADTCWGAEVLARWTRPDGSHVPPNEFIRVAEASSLIFELERFVLREACLILAGWQERDPMTTMRIAVNISGRHLAEGALITDVHEILLETGANPHLLELELTETHLLEDLQRAGSVLHELRSMGVTIAVDDFGTGYSSMTYLRDLPVDCVKIDRSFIASASHEGFDTAVIEALISIGRTIGLSIVAEGIETSEQLEYVKSRGIHRGQGFLLARPTPVAEAELLMFDYGAATSTVCV